MRLRIGLALLASVLIVAGCVPAALPTPAKAPTAAPSLATQVAAAAPASATPAPALATEVAAATATTQPAATATGTPASAGTVSTSTFTSTPLGITFSYSSSVDGQTIGVQEQADRVYVYVGNTQPSAGQYVQTYRKPAGQSLEDAIKAQVLKGYSLQDCPVTAVPNPEAGQQWPAGYTFAMIKLPVTLGADQEALQAAVSKCPQPYAALGGLAYFVADAQHPEQFVFFSIGQYAIPAGSPTRTWQTTLRFLGLPAAATAAPQPTEAVAPSATGYVDDRSSAASLITSYFNAINHYEYARAYGYWNQQAGQANGLLTFAQFRAGYTATKSVDLTLGTIRGDVGAGQLYYWVPVALVGHNADGTAQAFAGCYKMHLARPAIQAVPPFQPLAIESATVQQAADRAAAQAALAGVCGGGGQPLSAVPAPNPADLSAAQYIDDRSDASGVLRSLVNAINSKEYVRAYSYWEAGSSQRLPFDQFEQGYANTAAVEFVMGSTRPGAAAGNIYYQAPVVLTARNTDGTRQTFAGCYTLHMANPGMQMEPPFQPLGIQSAKVRQVSNDSDRQALLQSACSQ